MFATTCDSFYCVYSSNEIPSSSSSFYYYYYSSVAYSARAADSSAAKTAELEAF